MMILYHINGNYLKLIAIIAINLEKKPIIRETLLLKIYLCTMIYI